MFVDEVTKEGYLEACENRPGQACVLGVCMPPPHHSMHYTIKYMPLGATALHALILYSIMLGMVWRRHTYPSCPSHYQLGRHFGRV
jgi:hypothetical protein